jgi:hypothetical protein
MVSICNYFYNLRSNIHGLLAILTLLTVNLPFLLAASQNNKLQSIHTAANLLISSDQAPAEEMLANLFRLKNMIESSYNVKFAMDGMLRLLWNNIHELAPEQVCVLMFS